MMTTGRCRIMPLPVLTIVLALGTAAAQTVRHGSIPEAYWGRWTANSGTCGDAEKTAIVLSAKAYVSPTASCTVAYVSEIAGAHGPIYSARMQCSNTAGGAQTRSAANLIIRPESADRISAGASFESLIAYQRCSTGGPGVKQ